MATKKDFTEVLSERLSCELCGNGPRVGDSHWYHCQAYHPHEICQECKEIKEQHYCSCGEIIETLLKLDTMRFNCNNAIRGCEEILGGKAMIVHKIECVYRLVQCPHALYKCQVAFNELLDHMREKRHVKPSEFTIKKGEKFLYSDKFARNRNFLSRSFLFDDRVFLLTGCKRDILHLDAAYGFS